MAGVQVNTSGSTTDRGLKEFGPSRHSDSVAARFDPRRNSINALRLGLAALVLVSHSLTMSGGTDPLGDITGGIVDLGTVAVDGFFALSGFLIARSAVSSPTTGRFLWRRALRILPAFWICLAVTVAVFLPLAQVLRYGTLTGFPLTGPESALSYLLSNAALYIDQFTVRGLFDGRPVNGSLYTLFYEFACYLGVAVIGALGLIRRRRGVMVVVGGLLTVAAVADLLFAGVITGEGDVRWLFLRLGSMFVAGVLAYQWADRIPLRGRGAVAAVALLVGALAAAALFGQDPQSRAAYLVLAPAAVAYIVLFAGAFRRLHRVGSRRDLSYGLYIYAWPVQMTLLLLGAADWPLPVFVVAALTISLGLAFLSWTVVEAPALALKSWTPGWWPASGSRVQGDRSAPRRTRRRVSSRRALD